MFGFEVSPLTIVAGTVLLGFVTLTLLLTALFSAAAQRGKKTTGPTYVGPVTPRTKSIMSQVTGLILDWRILSLIAVIAISLWILSDSWSDAYDWGENIFTEYVTWTSVSIVVFLAMASYGAYLYYKDKVPSRIPRYYANVIMVILTIIAIVAFIRLGLDVFFEETEVKKFFEVTAENRTKWLKAANDSGAPLQFILQKAIDWEVVIGVVALLLLIIVGVKALKTSKSLQFIVGVPPAIILMIFLFIAGWNVIPDEFGPKATVNEALSSAAETMAKAKDNRAAAAIATAEQRAAEAEERARAADKKAAAERRSQSGGYQTAMSPNNGDFLNGIFKQPAKSVDPEGVRIHLPKCNGNLVWSEAVPVEDGYNISPGYGRASLHVSYLRTDGKWVYSHPGLGKFDSVRFCARNDRIANRSMGVKFPPKT